MTPLRHSMASVREQRRPAARVAPAEAHEVSAATKDGRPCLVRYTASGDVVSVWVPRFGDRPSELLDRLALVAREWLPWARGVVAEAEAHRRRS